MNRAARTLGVALCLILGVALSPAANAAFTGTTAAAPSFSTAKLEAPAKHPTNITISCGLLSATITVKNYGRVAHANYHEVAIYSGAGTTPIFVGDLSQKPGQTYTAPYLLAGSWRVEIRGMYKVEGTGNAWTGPALSQTLKC
jgi:hypothetical protein